MKYLWKFYKQHIWIICLCFFLLFCQVLAELILPTLMSNIINLGIVPGNMPYIYKIGGIMVLTAVGLCICAVFVSLLSSKVGALIGKEIRNGIFEKVTAFSSYEMNIFGTASLITRSTVDVQQIQMTTIVFLRMACFAPLMGIGALIMALRTSPSLSWTIALALGAVICIMFFSFKVTFPKFKIVQTFIDKLNLVMSERLSGLLVIRAFNTELKEEERFEDINLKLTKLNLFVSRAMSFMMPSMMLIMNLSSVLIVWVGAKLIDAQNLLIGDMLAFIQYAMHVIMSALFITMMFIFIPKAMVSASRIGEVISTEPSITDAPQSSELSNIDVYHNQPGVCWDRVSFSYPDANEKVIDDVSFVAKPGEITAIIGSTGSGKSTLVNLLPRFFDVTSGGIFINGINIKDIPQKKLRSLIGYIPQKGILFSGTIDSNLRYGNQHITQEELEQVLEISQSKDFVSEKNDGIFAAVTQGGTNVSGGQKQRLCIARALATKAPIYIFDDSFSSLDFKTDSALRAALKEHMSESTIIIVAQRINTIKDSDQIIVLENGKIAGKGTHSQLLESCKVYREIAASQLDMEEL